MINEKKVESGVFLKFFIAFSVVTLFFFANAPKANAQTGGDDILFAAEEMPTFPGGDKALHETLGKLIKYPKNAYDNNIEGKVLIRFVVSKDGSITNASVLRSADPSLDQAALEAVKSLPKFNPGKQGGKPVNIWYTLPIVFKI